MKKLISLVLAFMMLAGAAAAAVSADGSPFSDVKTTRWSYKSIKFAYDNGLMDGVGGGKFDPAGTMTRAMVVTVLWRMDDSPEVEYSDVFSDVKAGKYYTSAVMWAKNNAIVNGVSEGKFAPSGKITREQLATMMNRYAEYSGFDYRPAGSLDRFPDAGKAHSYAKDALLWATDKGLITGVKSGDADLLDPRGNATREQFAAILKRFIEADLSFPLEWNEPVLLNSYTEPDYPTVDDADVYVAVDGNDADTGTFDKPVATFARAAERVREIKETKTEGNIVVAFRAGDYGPLSVTLTAEDSGSPDQRIIYCKYGDGDVVFSGGARFGDDDFEELGGDEGAIFSSAAVDKIKKIRVDGVSDSVKIYSERGVCRVARFPNVFADGTDNLFHGAGYTVDGNHIHLNQVLLRRFNAYHTLEGVKLYGYLTTGWHKDLLSIGDVDVESGNVYIPHPEAIMGRLRYLPEFDSAAWHASAIVNASEELDAEDEYFLDTERGVIYFYDPHGEYVIPSVNATVRLSGASYVTLRGLSFVGSADASVRASYCSGIHIDMCSFKATAGNEFLVVEGSVKGEEFDFRLTNSSFELAPLYVARIHPYDDGTDRFETPTTGFIDNNFFGKVGITQDGGCALAVRDFDDLVISHNYFEDCTRYAVAFDGCVNMRAEYNAFMRCMYNSGGVFYTGNDREQFNNVIRYNVFYPTAWFGVYVDDGGVGVEVSNNLFYGIGNTVVMHDGRNNLVRDNVMINTVDPSGVSVTDEMVGYMNGVKDGTVDLNDASSRGGSFYRAWLDLYEAIENNEGYGAVMRERDPDLLAMSTDPADVGKPEFVLSPVNTVVGNVTMSPAPADSPVYKPQEGMDRYVILENNRGLDLKENPFFVNPTLGDYRLADGVTGCPDVQFEKIGRY